MIPAPTARVLVCLHYGIGDLVMQLPALRTLRRQWPHAQLTVIGAWPALELLESDPDFEERVAIQQFGFQHWGDEGSPGVRAAFAGWLSERRFDTVLDSAHAATGIQRVLEEVALRGPTTGREVAPGLCSAQAIWYASLAAWDLTSAEPMPSAEPHVPRVASERARAFLAARALAAPVGVAPVASSELKRWPIDRVHDVLRWLVRERDRCVLIFGLDPAGAQDCAFRERMGRDLPADRVCVVPRTHLQETAALMASCSAFLSNDTGLMHLAASMRTPTVGVFGPTSATVYLPSDAVAVTADRPCPYRLNAVFGPPDCVLAGTCLVSGASCIHDVAVTQVTATLFDVLTVGGAP